MLIAIALHPPGQAATALDGTWVVTTIADSEYPPALHAALVFDAGEYRSIHSGQVRQQGRIRLDTSARPWKLDLLIGDGDHAGKTQLALVDLNADTMTLALAAPGAGVRPASLSGGDFVALTRVKPLTRDLAGRWDGALDAGRVTRRVTLSLTNDTAGLAAGTIAGVDRGTRETPIAAVLIRDSRITLLVPAVQAVFYGELKDGRLTGRWMQRGGNVALTLHRTPK